MSVDLNTRFELNATNIDGAVSLLRKTFVDEYKKEDVSRFGGVYHVTDETEVKRFVVDSVRDIWQRERKAGGLVSGWLYVFWRGYAVNFERTEGVDSNGDYAEVWHAAVWMYC